MDIAKAREEARDLAPDDPPQVGQCLWLHNKLAEFSGNTLVFTPWWRETLLEYYRSGKITLVAGVGYRGFKSSEMALAAIQSAIFKTQKNIVGSACKVAIVSVNISESGQRNSQLQEYLKAFGYSQIERYSDAVGLGKNEYHRGGGQPGQPFAIKLIDGADNLIEIVAGPNNMGFTGFGSPCIVLDEFGQWPEGANQFLINAVARFSGYQDPHLLIMSRPYGSACPLTELAKDGDNDSRMVARLGVFGAQRDAECRAELKRFFEARARGESSAAWRARYTQWAIDARLQRPFEANAWQIPTWVAAQKDVLDLWTQALAGAKGEDALEFFFSAFGCMPSAAGTNKLFMPAAIRACVETCELVSTKPLQMKAAAIDAGSMRNSFALSIVGYDGALLRNVHSQVWRPAGDLPLDLRHVILPSVCATLKEHGISHLVCDPYALDQVILECAKAGISVQCEGGTTLERWQDVHTEIHRQAPIIRLAGEDGEHIAQTLEGVEKVTLPAGDVRVHIPTIGGYHGDLADAWRRAVRELLKLIYTNGRKIHGTTRRAYNVGTSQITAYK